MKKTVRRSIVIMLSFIISMMMSSLAFTAFAANVDTYTFAATVVDEGNNPVSGVVVKAYEAGTTTPVQINKGQIWLPDNEDIVLTSDDNGEVVRDGLTKLTKTSLSIDFVVEDEEYESNDVHTISVDSNGAIVDVNGVAFDSGNPPSLTFKVTSKSSGLTGWLESDFTYSGNTTITGLSETGKEKLKTNSELVLPDTRNGEFITAIGDGVTGMNKLNGADGPVGTFGFNENGITYVPTKVIFPSKLESIGKWAFMAAYSTDSSDQKGLTELNLPDTIKTIGMQAFQAIPVSEITIPDSVTEIGQAAFGGFERAEVKVSSVILPENPKFSTIPQACFSTQIITELSIPAGITTINRDAFSGNPLTSLTIPEGVKEINRAAFKNHQLTSLEIPSSVTKIDQSAFSVEIGAGRSATLSSLTFASDSNLTTIGKQAFENANLKEIDIPATVTSLDTSAFEGNIGGVDEDKRVIVNISVEDQFNATGNYTKFANGGIGHRGKYNDKTIYVVSFDKNGRTPLIKDAYTKNGVLTADELKDPTSTDKYDIFLGWFTEAEGGIQVKAEDAATTIFEKDTTLYAHWDNPLNDAISANEAAAAAAEEAANAAATAEESRKAAEEAAKTPGQAAIDAAKKAEADAQKALDAADKAKELADDAKTKADAAVQYAEDKALNATNKQKATDAQQEAADAVSNAEGLQAAATEALTNAKAVTKAVTDAKKEADKKAAEEKAKRVKTVTVNIKTVNAKAIDKALARAGGSSKYVTKIVLGKNVKKISKSAFKKYNKVKTLEVKTKKLKKKSVKGSLKGSKITTVKVKVGKTKTNKIYVKKYKKIFTKKNAGKKVKVKR